MMCIINRQELVGYPLKVYEDTQGRMVELTLEQLIKIENVFVE